MDAAPLELRATPQGYTATAPIPWAPTAASQQAELRWPTTIRNWIEPRCTVAAAGGRNLTIAPGCWRALIAANAGKLPPPPSFIENVAAGPPGPGEFLSTPDYVFYRPAAAAPYEEPRDAWAPVQETLIRAHGLRGHVFANLTFAHATWRQPSAPAGYVPAQTMVTTEEPPGTIDIARSVGVTVDRCTFENSGGAYALAIGGASQDVVVSRSRFVALSGGALRLGNVDGQVRGSVREVLRWSLAYPPPLPPSTR